VEFDVRRTRDGRLAVWHDAALADGRALLDTPWGQLDGNVDPLEAVLDATAGLELVNIEIKNWPKDGDYDPSHGIAAAVATVLRSRSPAERDRFLVSCFHVPTLTRLRQAAPEIATGWLVDDASDVDGMIGQAADAGHRALHPFHRAVTPELVERAHGAGLAVNCWTCNDLDRIRWLAEIGTDGIITDIPGEAKAALGR
jgi:glycerophosphoryl diester phosphodiesterase